VTQRGTRSPPPAIPLTFITGPLGSGKSRMVNRITALPACAATLALANETGRTPLLSPIPVEEEPDIAAGCLCCTAQGRLSGLLENLLRKRDNHRIIPFDRVILETAGEADPAAMAGEILAHPYLSKRYALTGIITLLNAETLPEQAEVAALQLAAKHVGTLDNPAALLSLPWTPAEWPEAARQRLYRLGRRFPSR